MTPTTAMAPRRVPARKIRSPVPGAALMRRRSILGASFVAATSRSASITIGDYRPFDAEVGECFWSYSCQKAALGIDAEPEDDAVPTVDAVLCRALTGDAVQGVSGVSTASMRTLVSFCRA